MVDADEEVSPELAREVQKVLSNPSDCVAYKVLRVDLVLGRWLKHGGFYPHYELRLFKRGHVRHDPRPIHRKAVAEGPVGKINAPLWHYTAEDFAEWLVRNIKRARIEAEWDFLHGKRFSGLEVAGAFGSSFAGSSLKADFWTVGLAFSLALRGLFTSSQNKRACWNSKRDYASQANG